MLNISEDDVNVLKQNNLFGYHSKYDNGNNRVIPNYEIKLKIIC